MDKGPQKQAKISKRVTTDQDAEEEEEEEVSSSEWEVVEMSEQEQDLIYRLYRLVGQRWDLIAGRIPGRRAEEIERFWIMRHALAYAPTSTAKHIYRDNRRS